MVAERGARESVEGPARLHGQQPHHRRDALLEPAAHDGRSAPQPLRQGRGHVVDTPDRMACDDRLDARPAAAPAGEQCARDRAEALSAVGSAGRMAATAPGTCR